MFSEITENFPTKRFDLYATDVRVRLKIEIITQKLKFCILQVTVMRFEPTASNPQSFILKLTLNHLAKLAKHLTIVII